MAVPIAIGLGYWCDHSFDSTPIGLVLGTAVGFGAMLLRIMRMRPTEGGEQDETRDSAGGKETPTETEPVRDEESN
jgi:F0F1-type ATP synthase assembly protein I